MKNQIFGWLSAICADSSEVFSPHAIADFLTSLAYFSIPITMMVVVKKRKNFEYRWMFICFMLFILLCGITHLLHMLQYIMLSPAFILIENIVKTMTAGVSILTAGLLWKIIPKLLLIPSPAELQKANEEILHLANHDTLTGLANRNYFNILMDKSIAEASEHHFQMAVVFIDLDRFKMINDTYGHDVGDLLLKDVSMKLKKSVREQDIVSRQGGDEFILLLPDISREETEKVMDTIIESLALPFILEGSKIHCTPSAGISFFPFDGTSAETLIKYADLAMYKAKDKGRNNYHFYTAELNQEISSKVRLESELRKALEEGQFEVYYQPQLDLKQNSIVSAEALLRWNHPERGFVSPLEFIPIAGETGLILPIGEWVLREACRQTKIWRTQGHDMSISVNLSNRQLMSDHIVKTIQRVLLDTGLDSNYLTLEITESMAIKNFEDTHNKLGQLIDFGVNLALDDFGTGYSSLSYLSILPISSVKIDKSFIQDIDDSTKREIVQSISNIAQCIGLKVVAEGVENEQQFNIIRSMGLEMMQGYFLSRPVPNEELGVKLSQFNGEKGPAK